MFPQMNMRPELYYNHSHFITCNLSVRRDAVLAAGSFDPAFRLGEDTELGLRIGAKGCRVLFHPAAKAIHDHLDMTMDDMVRRAKAYGPVYLRLLQKHPTLKISHPGIELAGPVTTADIERIRETLQSQREQIDEMVKALKQYDNRDFEPAFAKRTADGCAAEMIVNLFRQAIPQVHWFHVFDGLCSAWTDQAVMPPVELVGTGARV
jgi:Glycosyl transferase family group 2